MKRGTISVLSAIAGAIGGMAAGAGFVAKAAGEIEEKNRMLADKHLALFLLMNQWVKVKQEGKSVESYLIGKGYRKIAIYGMSYVGETLVSELDGLEIEVAYGIDKNANGIYTNMKILSVEEQFESVDAIIVTAITYFDEIEQELRKKVDCPIINLEDILYEI